MRLQSYILTETSDRGKILNHDEALNLLQRNCKQALKAYEKGNRIYRGTRSRESYLYYDPKSASTPRRSKNTDNYYTMIMDNAPQWKRYPKRSESLICTTNINTAMAYGYGAYSVFPYDGATIGVAPESDLWFSFGSIIHSNLDTWNTVLKRVFDISGIPLSDTSYSKMVDSFTKFDTKMKSAENIKQVMTELEGVFMYNHLEWMRKYDPEKGLLKHIQENVLSPTKNDFRISSVDKVDDSAREVWTDSKCILVIHKRRNNPTDDIMDELST